MAPWGWSRTLALLTVGAMEPTYFSNPMTDRLLAVCMTLATETWVSRQRIARLEARLSLAGIPDTANPASPDDQQGLDAFVAQLMAALDGDLASQRIDPAQLRALLGATAHD